MSDKESTSDWLQRSPTPDAQGRLFCFAYAGGSAGVFRGWLQSFSNVEIVAMQLPGRENRHRDKLLVDMDDVAAEVAASMQGLMDLPFAFFGYSLGSLIAFETARLLRRSGRAMPKRLIVAASPAPQHEHARKPPIHLLSDADLIAEMRRFKGTPDAVFAHRELLNLLLPVIRADFELLETYRCRDDAPLAVPISALGGVDDVEVAPYALADWSEQTSAGFSMRFLPGDHFFLKTAQDQLLGILAQELQSAFPKTRTS
ncbi:MAG: putative thioesterase [Planctomycetia bacterium]|nr:putative thioesterase [Planctomycetia bacterium]